MGELPFLDHALTTHEEVIARARLIGRERGLARVVVAAAEEDDLLAALYACRREEIATSLLVGRPERIAAALAVAGAPGDAFEIIPAENDEEAALKAATLAAGGEANVVMKGYLKTSTLLKMLLKHEHGLRDRELVSHSALLYVPGYGKLLNITDGGTLVAPTLPQKLTVIANGVQVLRSVGIMKPRIAVFGPSDEMEEGLPETLAAAELVEAARRRWEGELFIEGPMPYDLAVTDPARLRMPLCSEVAGRADMLLVHTVEEGNIIAKTLIQFGGAVFMGVIAGARVPISLVSRSDSMINKMASVALAVCLSDYLRRGFEPLPAVPGTEKGGAE